MSEKPRFEDIDTSKYSAQRKNPFEKAQSKAAHKTIRIYEEDYKELRALAFHEDKSIVQIVAEAVELLKRERGQ
ncbi:hypothetical protein MKZ02_22715 [Pseudobacillus sp. FSL P4-0506]|uniref:hypothetical protein n=1 Tax=Pseudobacillus sp. FSL P4-0506 TaxID=2921576 RepID=UPI0030FB5562